MSHHFELEDAPGLLGLFPLLIGKDVIGQGEFSVVFEGTRPDTVLKLTCDSATINFLTMKNPQAGEGLVEVVKYHGYRPNKEHGYIHLIELVKLTKIDPEIHRALHFERESLMAAVRHRVWQSDRYEGVIDAQSRCAGAIQELARSQLFSGNINKALTWIATFLRTSPLDLLHDLCNPENYMTDGIRLIITDPLVLIPAD